MLPSEKIISAARAASAGMADRETPFLFDEWYVAAFDDDVGRSLLPRTILGKKVLFYRTEGGEPIALDDRCAHRSYPLSAGELDGDTVICGYHGFRYDASGNCVQVPSMVKCPRTIGVHRYPVVEQGPLIWIWMDASKEPDYEKLPDISFAMSDKWTSSKGYLAHPGNYISLHENLLDLTHLSYVHARSFGTPDYALAPFKTIIAGGHFKIRRDVVPTTLPPVWAEPTGLTGVATAARIASSEYLSPAFHLVTVSFYDSALNEAERPIFTIKTAHLPTPATNGTTHYFIMHGRDFALNDPTVTQTMHDRLFAAFQEDVEALGRLEETLISTAASDIYEISVPSDAPSVAMRRHIYRETIRRSSE